MEAAVAASRIAGQVRLLTLCGGRVGELSCNPSIGGVAKGTLVREIGVLGAAMARSADGAEIQFRMLNVSKGPAVWGPRKQQDELLYRRLQRAALESSGVELIEAEAVALDGPTERLPGVVTPAGAIRGDAVVLATGTFLGGRLFRGRERWAGGRIGDGTAEGMDRDLRERMFHVKRFKTGTPPRLLASSVDTSRMTPQEEDGPGYAFAHGSGPAQGKRGQCWITATTAATCQAARDGMGSSPLFGGDIGGRGPRYCPSFEDKVMRFPDRSSHRVFVEPMGNGSRLVYPSGISTSLDRRTQMEMLGTIPGLERAEVARFGYAVEYGWLGRGEFDRTLRARGSTNLFFAGQICGTSGYEEAAALGLLAGANAARVSAGLEPRAPDRMESYLGVMVDDLVSRGTREPYRLFSSRAENRMHLRQDNVPARMAGLCRELFGGLPGWVREWTEAAAGVDGLLESARADGVELSRVARRPSTTSRELMRACGALEDYPEDVVRSRMLDCRYRGYIRRARARAGRLAALDGVRLDGVEDFMEVRLITVEARQALNRERPATLGEAARLPEVRHSDLEGLMLHLCQGCST